MQTSEHDRAPAQLGGNNYKWMTRGVLTARRYTDMIAWLLARSGFGDLALAPVDLERSPTTAVEAMVMAFQRLAGLTADGEFGPRTAARLDQLAAPPAEPPPAQDTPPPPHIPAPTAALSSEQLAVATRYNQSRRYTASLWRKIQAAIGTDADGVPGPATARKLAAFQAARDLPVDGQAGPRTLSALRLGQFFAFDDHAVFYGGGMAIDADGAPNAYHPDNIGICANANAGIGDGRKPWGIALTSGGEPYVQGANHPCPGYYVSTTSLCYRRHGAGDPRRFVDATRIPYIAIPAKINDYSPAPAIRPGDIAAVVRSSDIDRVVYAVYADVAPGIGSRDTKWIDTTPRFGEGSIKLAEALGHDPYRWYQVGGQRVKRAGVGIASGVVYVVFPGSGDHAPSEPLTAADIDALGERAFARWGGRARLDQAVEVLRAVGNLR